jgi:hypothetical protein
MKSAFSVLLLSSLVAAGCAHNKYAVDSFHHIGQINAPCADAPPGACVINHDLRVIDECTKIDTECEGGNQLLDDLFGHTRHTKFANYIVYFDQHDTPGTFVNHRPILMWNARNTRYLYGVQEVYVLLLTEYKACLSAQITTIAKNEPNPFDAVLKALGKPLGPTDSPVALKTQAAKLFWYPLSGDEKKPVMWLAIGSLPVETGTTDWITVQFTKPKVQSKSQQEEKPLNLPDECVVEWPVTYKAPFLAHNAFFSDNREGRVGVGIAFGLTFSGRKVGPDGTSNQNLNGYALAKVYPFSHFRPRLVTDPNSTGGSIAYVRPSLGIVIGTNIFGDSSFSELLVGVSVGHLFGTVGLIVGVNDFLPAKPPAGEVNRRRGRPFVGIEYSF